MKVFGRTLTARNAVALSFAAAFILAATVCTFLIKYNTRQRALVEAEEKARIFLDQNRALLSHFRDEIRPKLLTMEWNAAPDAFDPALMSSFYTLRKVNEGYNSFGGTSYHYRVCAVNARSPLSEADSYEAGIIKRFNDHPDNPEHNSVREIDGVPCMVIMRAGTRVNESCMRCHSAPEAAPAELVERYGRERGFAWQAGRIVSAYTVRVPLSEALEAANGFAMHLCVVLGGTLLGLYALLTWLADRFVFRPLNLVGDRAARIAVSPDEYAGEEVPLPPGVELRRLTSSFNDMSRAVRAEKDQLKSLVELRTVQLLATAQALDEEAEERKRSDSLVRMQRDLGIRLGSRMSLSDALALILDTAVQVSEMDCGGVYLIGESPGALELVVHKGASDAIARSRAPFGFSLEHLQLLMRGEPIYVSRAGSSEGEGEAVALPPPPPEDLMTMAALPVMNDGKAIACVCVASRSGTEVPVHARVALEAIASQTGSVIARLESEQQLMESEEKYRRLFHNELTAISIFDIDTLRFLDVNEAYEQLYGYSRREILEDMSVHDISVEHEKSDDAVKEAVAGGTVFIPLRYHRKKDGTVFPVEIVGGPYMWKGRRVMFAMARDITSRKNSEDRIAAALGEKEVLLREIHHRVKNNLQIVCSLLSLQSRSVQDRNVQDVLRETRDRILSMAFIHDRLCDSPDMSSVDMGGYLRDLAAHLVHSYSTGRVGVDMRIAVQDSLNGSMSIDAAISCGLILNELVSNALKHAFPGGRRGVLLVELKAGEGDRLCLIVSDDGVGIPPDADPGMGMDACRSLGFKLVNRLVGKLEGSIVLEREGGTAFRIEFPRG